MAKTGDVCPDGCGRSLALARMHCMPEQRVVPCGWVRCECGAVIRPDLKFIPAQSGRELR